MLSRRELFGGLLAVPLAAQARLTPQSDFEDLINEIMRNGKRALTGVKPEHAKVLATQLRLAAKPLSAYDLPFKTAMAGLVAANGREALIQVLMTQSITFDKTLKATLKKRGWNVDALSIAHGLQGDQVEKVLVDILKGRVLSQYALAMAAEVDFEGLRPDACTPYETVRNANETLVVALGVWAYFTPAVQDIVVLLSMTWLTFTALYYMCEFLQ